MNLKERLRQTIARNHHADSTFEVYWSHSIVEQCKAAGVPCFIKQLGSVPYLDRLDKWSLMRDRRQLDAGINPVIDTATHWPYPCDRKKMIATIERSKATKTPTTVEIVYANQHRAPAIKHDREFRTIKFQLDALEIESIENDDLKLINIGTKVYTSEFRSWLKSKLPDPSPWEIRPGQ